MATENILLKEVIFDNRTDGTTQYGSEKPFVVGLANGSPNYALSPAYYNDSYCYTKEQIPEECTDLMTIFDKDLDIGKIYEAFDSSGAIKMGFRIMFRGTQLNGGDVCYSFLVYNEEIGAGVLYVEKAGFSFYDYLHPIKSVIVVNGMFPGGTAIERLSNAESTWYSKTTLYKEGMSTHKNSFLQILSQVSDYDNAYRYYLCDNNNTIYFSRMRFYSSWYKLWTGEFYLQSNMFHATLADGREYYFGKAIEWSDKTTISENDTITKYLDKDPSYVFLDVIFGSDPCFFIRNDFSNQILFQNGMSIKVTHGSNNVIPNVPNMNGYNLVLRLEKSSEEGLLVFSQWFSESATETDGYYISTIQQYINNVKLISVDREKDYGPTLFISPQYNEWTASGFKKALQSAKADDWKLLLDRVFTFCSDKIVQIDESLLSVYNREYTNYYYTELVFSGISNPIYDYLYYATVYREQYNVFTGNEEFYITNIDTNEDWAIFVDFTATSFQPPNTGGGGFGGVGGRGTFNTSSDKVKPPGKEDLNILSYYLQGTMLRMWYIGISKASAWLSAISDWLNDTSIFASFEERAQGILSLKLVNWVSTPPGLTAQTFSIRGSSITKGELPNEVLTQQFDVQTLGDFSVEKFFDNYLDYDKTSIKIYLPFSGTYELNPSLLVGGTCTLTATVDFLTGDIIYNINVRRDSIDSTIYTFNGNCAFDIPITSIDYSGKISGAINAAMSIAGSAMTGNVISAGNGAIQGIKALKDPGQIQTNGAMSKTLGVMAVRYPYLIIERPVMTMPSNYGSIYGWKTSVGGQLGSFSGVTVVKDLHLEDITGATSQEIDEIESLLKEGVIL